MRLRQKDYLESSRNPNLKINKIKNRGEEFETEMLKNKNPIVDRVLIGKDTGWIWSAY